MISIRGSPCPAFSNSDTSHSLPRRCISAARRSGRNVTQPTLSAQLSKLEDELGVQLVERSRARVVMTPRARRSPQARATDIGGVDEIAEIARRGQTMLAGTIRVGVVQSLGSYFLPLVIPDLHLRYPDLRLYVREGLADDLVRRLEEGSLDLLFFPLPITGHGIRRRAPLP
jgi:LysR family hydrogen peroxide-inducible transcriptional activator